MIEKNDIDKAVKIIIQNNEKLNNREDTRSAFDKDISYDFSIKKLHKLYLDTVNEAKSELQGQT